MMEVEVTTDMQRKIRRMKMRDAGSMIKAGKLTAASLYEPDHAPVGTEFVMVEDHPQGRRLFRVR